VTQPLEHAELRPPSFDPDSGTLRFWVALPAGPPIGASLSRQVLHYRFHAHIDGHDA